MYLYDTTISVLIRIIKGRLHLKLEQQDDFSNKVLQKRLTTTQNERVCKNRNPSNFETLHKRASKEIDASLWVGNGENTIRELIAAAGFYIPLVPCWHSKSLSFATRFSMPTTHEQPDFAHCKFLVFCSLQPTKSACSAAAEKCLSGVGQPLSSVSGRKRYNTLDFASKIVCKQGCSRPYWKPRAKGFHPSGHPHIFFSKMVPKL